jgi:hypothetical protein
LKFEYFYSIHIHRLIKPQKTYIPKTMAAASGTSRKKVRFDEETTKPNDGLSEQSKQFEEYIKQAFRPDCESLKPDQTVPGKLANKLNLNGLNWLYIKLVDLIERCEQSPTERAPVLLHGGSSEFINAKYIPYLLTHAEYLDTVIQKVEQYIATHAIKTPTVPQSGGGK